MEWIDVKDRLPEYGQPVLVSIAGGPAQYSAYTRDIGEWRSLAVDDADPIVPFSLVTHWIPIPKGPKEKSNVDR